MANLLYRTAQRLQNGQVEQLQGRKWNTSSFKLQLTATNSSHLHRMLLLRQKPNQVMQPSRKQPSVSSQLRAYLPYRRISEVHFYYLLRRRNATPKPLHQQPIPRGNIAVLAPCSRRSSTTCSWSRFIAQCGRLQHLRNSLRGLAICRAVVHRWRHGGIHICYDDPGKQVMPNSKRFIKGVVSGGTPLAWYVV